MWELDHKEGWSLKNWCFWTVVLEKTLESSLDCKEIKPVNPKGNKSWIFIGRTDTEAEAPLFCPPDAKNWLIEKDSNAGTDWRQEEKGITEDEMAGWHHRLNGHEFEQALGAGEGQGGLACCSPWGYKELDMTMYSSSSSWAPTLSAHQEAGRVVDGYTSFSDLSVPSNFLTEASASSWTLVVNWTARSRSQPIKAIIHFHSLSQCAMNSFSEKINK